eukprot:jgi/Bigna1/53852/estExt_Genewise1Plus.C_250060
MTEKAPDNSKAVPVSQDVNEILPNFLYLGSKSAVNEDTAKALKLTGIVNCADEVKKPDWVDAKGLKYIRFPLDDMAKDWEEVEAHWKKAIEFIDAQKKANGRVLVHCVRGANRSASTVVRYLMHTGKDGKSAVAHAKKCRKKVRPYPNFVAMLIEVEKRLGKDKGKATLDLLEYNVDWICELIGSTDRQRVKTTFLDCDQDKNRTVQMLLG